MFDTRVCCDVARYEKGAVGGGVGEPFAVVGISGSLTANSYSSPIWAGGAGAGTLAGVITAGIRPDSEEGCTNACQTNGNAARVASAAAAFVSGPANVSFAQMTTLDAVAAAAKGLYLAYVGSRGSVRAPSMGIGTFGDNCT